MIYFPSLSFGVLLFVFPFFFLLLLPCIFYLINVVCFCLVIVSDSFVTSWTVTHQVSVHGILQARILGRVAISFSRGLSRPFQIEPASPELQADSFTAEPPEKQRWLHFI